MNCLTCGVVSVFFDGTKSEPCPRHANGYCYYHRKLVEGVSDGSDMLAASPAIVTKTSEEVRRIEDSAGRILRHFPAQHDGYTDAYDASQLANFPPQESASLIPA